MRDGVCPKCSSRSVYGAAGGLKHGTQGALVAPIEPGFRGIRQQMSAEGIWQFMCADCGYMESYALDDAARQFVRDNWRAAGS
jgi:hypothetical protein